MATALLLAGLTVVAHEGVPGHVAERARAVVEAALEGSTGEFRLELFETSARMRAALRRVDPVAPAGAPAYFHYGTRALFAWMAPRPAPALFEERLPGILVGALVHEVQHARGLLADPSYPARPAHQTEGEADRDAIAFLRGRDWPGAGAWELLARSRVFRASDLFLPPERFAGVQPGSLPPAQRAAWYAQAYVQACGGRTQTPPDWIVWDGSAEPVEGGFRLASFAGGAALLVRAAEVADLRVDVVPLAVGAGEIDLLFDFRSDERYAKVSFARDGGVRVLRLQEGAWHLEARADARPGRRFRLGLSADGAVRVDGEVVLRVARQGGLLGYGVRDAAADFLTPSS